jgi:nucleoside-diphosphate-sugar epimerase
MPHLFCFGVGFSGRTLAQRLIDQGWQVSGTSRSDQGCETLKAQGITAHRFDGTEPLPATAFEGVTHILSSIPPDEQGDPALRLHQDTVQQLGKDGSLSWVGYLSTTGVYGDHAGGWVDEETPVAPDVARSRRRVLAEQQWLKTTPAAHLFRLAGIYGPGRNALIQVQSGKARCIIKENQWFCRIHVDDIASVVETSIAHPNAGRIYNVCDDLPAPPQDPIRYAASLLGLPAPPDVPFEKADLTPMAQSFYADSRRVHNSRIRSELGVNLRYPTYREGLTTLYNSLDKD